MPAKAARRVQDHLPDADGYPRWSFQVELSDADVIAVSKGEMPVPTRKGA